MEDKMPFCDLLTEGWALLDEAEQERIVNLLWSQAKLQGQSGLMPTLQRSLNWILLFLWRWEVGSRIDIRSNCGNSEGLQQ